MLHFTCVIITYVFWRNKSGHVAFIYNCSMTVFNFDKRKHATESGLWELISQFTQGMVLL